MVEATLSLLYQGDWPARVWARVPERCTVHVIRRTLSFLPASVPQLRIGFASDLHIGPTTPPRLLEVPIRTFARPEVAILTLESSTPH